MPGSETTQTIAWDVDDVLNELTRAWYEGWVREGGGGPAGGYEGLARNPPDMELGLTREAYLRSLDAFRASEQGRDLAPRPEALAWFEEFGDAFRNIAVTATPLANAPASAAWVMRHFGRWIRTYHVVPSPRPADAVPSLQTTKADFLAWLGKVDLVVDDSPEVAEAARALGIRALVFPAPWNDGTGSARDAFGSIAGMLGRDRPGEASVT